MRLILQNQDLTGQTLQGQPFSYIGNCTGADVVFIGDWTHVSLFSNDFLRPDWSQAQTRWSYSRFNTFTDIEGSPDLELLDHEMMLALFKTNLSLIPARDRATAHLLIANIEADRARQDYIISWANVAPIFAENVDLARAEAVWSTWVGNRAHLVRQYVTMHKADKTKASFDVAAPPTDMPSGGVATGDWGIAARNSRDKREFRLRWTQLPTLTRPHDRVEMAERVEALIEQATDQKVTLYVQSILPWRCRIGGREQARGDLTR